VITAPPLDEDYCLMTTSADRKTGRRASVMARLGLITTSLTLVAFGPGLALAEARIASNHNEILTTTRR
jgi:hypothetical protein